MTADLNTLMERLDVFISVKPKPKQTTKVTIISNNMYHHFNILL